MTRDVRCKVRYERRIGRGVCYAPHEGGGGHYARDAVWETMILAAAVAALGPPVLLACLAARLFLGKE